MTCFFEGTDVAIAVGGSTARPLYQGPLVASDFFRALGYGFNTENGLDALAQPSLPGASFVVTISCSQLRCHNGHRFRSGEHTCLTVHGFNEHNVRADTNTLLRVVKPVPDDLSLRAAQLAVGK